MYRRKELPALSISIHAPRTGSDQVRIYERRLPHISIHAPRTGSDRHGVFSN